MSEPLSAEQVEFFRREGYIVAPSLIDQDLVTNAEAAMWEWLGAAQDQPDTWPEHESDFKERLKYLNDDVFFDVYTPTFMNALEQLTGRTPKPPGGEDVLQAIVAFPTHEPWRWHGVHVDNAVEAWGLKTFPTSQSGNTLVYL